MADETTGVVDNTSSLTDAEKQKGLEEANSSRHSSESTPSPWRDRLLKIAGAAGLIGGTVAAGEKVGVLNDPPSYPETSQAQASSVETTEKPNPFLGHPVINGRAKDANGNEVRVDGVVVVRGTENQTRDQVYQVQLNEGASEISSLEGTRYPIPTENLALFGINTSENFTARPIYGKGDEIITQDGQTHKVGLLWEVSGKNSEGQEMKVYFPNDSVRLTDPRPLTPIAIGE